MTHNDPPPINLRRWATAIKDWIRRGRYFWFAVIAPVAVTATAVLLGDPSAMEDRIRLGGLSLNVLGLLIVGVELAQVQGQFKGNKADGVASGIKLAIATLWEWARQYFRSLPKWRFRDFVMNAREGSSAGRISVSGVGAGLTVGKLTLDKRVELLEALQKEDRHAITETRRELHDTTFKLDELKSAVDGKHREFDEKLRELATSGLPAQAMGWVLLLVGTVLDGAAKELTRFIQAVL